MTPLNLLLAVIVLVLAVCLAACVGRLRGLRRRVAGAPAPGPKPAGGHPAPPAPTDTAVRLKVRYADILRDITDAMNHELEKEKALQATAEIIGTHFDVSSCLIRRVEPDETGVNPIIGGFANKGVPRYQGEIDRELMALAPAYFQRAYERDAATAIHNVRDIPELSACVKLFDQYDVASFLLMPTFYENTAHGSITLVQMGAPRRWTDDEITVIESVARQVGIAFAQARLTNQVESRVAELAAKNEDLEQARIEAEAANQAKSVFLANMSHELRTPLNAILGFAQVLQRDDRLEGEHLEQMAIINRSAEHLLDLINDVLEMSKIEAGHVALEAGPVDLWELLRVLENMLITRALNRGLLLAFDVGPAVPRWISSDEKKLRQVLINLVGNAIKFTDSGRIEVRARVTSHDGGDALRFDVTDTGPGIDEDALRHLFDPFYQGDSARTALEGTGLGLPISREYVQLMGGAITVESTPDHGSTFAFEIPLQPLDESEVREAREQRILDYRVNDDADARRILVVDDDGDNLQLLSTLLRKARFEVHTATSGEEALTAWRAWQPDLILMDLRMPGLDGRETTCLIRAEQTGTDRRTAIIALTADVLAETPEEVLAAGCDDFLAKPYRNEELLEVIGKHIDITYQVRSIESATPAPGSLVRDETKLAHALTKLAPDELAQFSNALLHLDASRINEIVQRFRAVDPDAYRVISQYTGAYEYDLVLACIDNPEGAGARSSD